MQTFVVRRAVAQPDLRAVRLLVELLERLEAIMLWTIAVVLLLLWAAGLVTSYTMGGFIHLLLVVAVVMVLVSLITGRRASI